MNHHIKNTVPIGSDGENIWNVCRNSDQKSAIGREEYLVEGPGLVLNSSDFKLTSS